MNTHEPCESLSHLIPSCDVVNIWLIFDFIQDGGLLINNPTALAIHESKCLWPNTPVQCVVSLGTGRYETIGKTSSSTYTSLKTKLTNVISSATDTEGEMMGSHDHICQLSLCCSVLLCSTYSSAYPKVEQLRFIFNKFRDPLRFKQYTFELEVAFRKLIPQH